MASYYVYSGAGGAGTGADWANAYTTLAAAVTGKAAGDIYYVAHDHAETQASAMTIAFPGTPASPDLTYCVNRAGSVPPVSADLRTTATVTTTGVSAITVTGSAYIYGITFNCGSGATTAALTIGTASGTVISLENCTLAKNGTTGNVNAITIGTANSAGNVILNNSKLSFGSTGDRLRPVSSLYWKNTAAAIQGAVPAPLLGTATGGGLVLFEGIDLSALSVFNASNATFNGDVSLRDCKLGVSTTFQNPTVGPVQRIFVVNSDSGPTNYRNELYTYQGAETTDTTITRVGGASDGTTSFSRKLVTTANSKWISPMDALPIVFWNETVGVPQKFKIEGTWNSGSVPNNDDIWIELSYPGASATPIASFANNTKATNLDSGTALSASTETWNGGGSGAGWSPFELSVTTTPQMKGPVYAIVKCAKASSTFYIDPKIIIGAAFILFDEALNNIGKNLIDLDSHSFKAYLSNTAPDKAAHAVKADIAEISAGNGYSAGGFAMTTSWSETGAGTGIWRFGSTVDPAWTASGGEIATHRYLIVYSDTATNDELIGYVDRGASASIAAGATRTWDVGASGLFEMAGTP